jgi:ubiquinone biosynthesis protein UbiJ
MSLLADAFATTKKILLVSEELNRLSEDTKTLARAVADHEHRLIRLETTVDLALRGSRRRLPGN